MESEELVLNKYKTVRAHGKRVINIPTILADIIKSFHEKSNSKYLICNRTGKKYTSIAFNKACHSCFKKKASSSMIRRCIVSEKIDNGMTAEERKNTAKIMAHSLQTQQMFYSRYSVFLHPKNDDFMYLVKKHELLIQQLKENNNRMYELVMKKYE